MCTADVYHAEDAPLLSEKRRLISLACLLQEGMLCAYKSCHFLGTVEAKRWVLPALPITELQECGSMVRSCECSV